MAIKDFTVIDIQAFAEGAAASSPPRGRFDAVGQKAGDFPKKLRIKYFII